MSVCFTSKSRRRRALIVAAVVALLGGVVAAPAALAEDDATAEEWVRSSVSITQPLDLSRQTDFEISIGGDSLRLYFPPEQELWIQNGPSAGWGYLLEGGSKLYVEVFRGFAESLTTATLGAPLASGDVSLAEDGSWDFGSFTALEYGWYTIKATSNLIEADNENVAAQICSRIAMQAQMMDPEYEEGDEIVFDDTAFVACRDAVLDNFYHGRPCLYDIVGENLSDAESRIRDTDPGDDDSGERLSSGYRINRAGDDAAGLAIGEGCSRLLNPSVVARVGVYDPDVPASLTIHKLSESRMLCQAAQANILQQASITQAGDQERGIDEAQRTPWCEAADGTWIDPSELPPGATPISGVEFTLLRAPNPPYDMTTGAGWAAAQLLLDALPDDPRTFAQLRWTLLGSDLIAPEGWTEVGTIATDAAGVAAFEGLELGLYLVAETHTPPGVVPGPPFFVILPMTNPDGDGWLYDVHVYPKNPSIEAFKEVDDAQAYLGGDVVTYTVSLPIPVGTTRAVIVDDLDPRLEFVEFVGFFDEYGVDLEPLTKSADGATCDHDGDPSTPEITHDICVIWDFSQYAPEDPTPAAVFVSFTVKVTGPGVIPNTAGFYLNTVNGWVDGESNEVLTKWGEVILEKLTSDGRPLTGAHFALYAGHPDDPAAKMLDDDIEIIEEDGQYKFLLRYSYFENNGLTSLQLGDPGELQLLRGFTLTAPHEYWLVEVQAPTGYELQPEPIGPLIVTEGRDGELLVNYFGTELTRLELRETGWVLTVINIPTNAGFELPSIGGNRAILPMIAALVALAGTVWMVRSRRRSTLA